MNYTVRPKNGFAIASMALMAVFAALRVYCFRDLSGFWAWAYLYVPVGAAVLFVAFLLLFGRRTLLPLCLPVVGGVAFFIVKAFTFSSPLHTALCCALYMAVLLLTCLTFFGLLRTKYLLYPLYGLPLLVHIGMDVYELFFAAERTPFTALLPEMSVLCIMAALLCLAIAMERQK